MVLFFDSSPGGSAHLCQFVRSLQNATNLATSKRYSPGSPSDALHSASARLVDILDLLSTQPTQSQAFLVRNEFWNYSRADYLALLHFFVSSVLVRGDSNNNEGVPGDCPVRETAHVVLQLLQKHAEHIFAGGPVSP
uniref:E3 ubiquitin-protein ligase n=1 Tax=Steinernema glaseri TaxID=37863 RepID=A0A1I7YHX2_9BILA